MDNNTNFAQDFPETDELQAEGTMDTAVDTVPVVKERETYALADGTEGSRAAFIREKFVDENLSRKQIAEEYGFDYRVVYSATVNMTNEAEATTRGRSATNAVIKVNGDNQLVEVKTIDGAPVTFVNSEAVDFVYGEEDLADKKRNDWITEMVDGGVSRGDVAKMLDLSYGVVYGLTKDAEGTRSTHMVTLEDGTEMSRSEYIRKRVAEGLSRSEVAKELDVAYSVVWQATKVDKTAQEKFDEAVANIKGFADKVADAEAFGAITTALEGITLVEEEAAAEAPVEEVTE